MTTINVEDIPYINLELSTELDGVNRNFIGGGSQRVVTGTRHTMRLEIDQYMKDNNGANAYQLIAYMQSGDFYLEHDGVQYRVQEMQQEQTRQTITLYAVAEMEALSIPRRPQRQSLPERSYMFDGLSSQPSFPDHPMKPTKTPRSDKGTDKRGVTLDLD